MGDQKSSELPAVSLQSKDHEDLLNIIDLLRSQGISRYVDLPQLIVCGEQSSGKSSVLEAVSGVRFPSNDELCTRFATELILRRDPTDNVRVSITPSPDRPDNEKINLRSFEKEIASLDGFKGLVESAKEFMGIDGENKAFSRDILRVVVSGPIQPHLTLVDLPGLFQAGNKAQSDEDVEVVKSLVLSYMKKSRSIILAVVSAKNDLANQIVTRYARDHDPYGYRTLGIITKPDTLHQGSGSERKYWNLANNNDVHFRLGWHVLKNRDFDTIEVSAERRDELERDFFSKGIWAGLPPNLVGISTLRPKLSNLLKEQILVELPGLIDDVKKEVKDCKDILSKLGESRATLLEQQLYLVRVSTKFQSLVKSAIDGTYSDKFFGSDLSPTGFSKRLRAVVQKTCLELAKEIRVRGHSRHIVDDGQNTTSEYGFPTKITRSKYIQEVTSLMERNRGRELPGTYNPLIIGDLFRQRSAKWDEVIGGYTKRILDAVRETLDVILTFTADEATGEGIFRHLINPAMDRVQKSLEEKVASILDPHRHGHPITYNHYLTDTIQKIKAQHKKNSQAAKLWSFFGKDIRIRKINAVVHPEAVDLNLLLEALNESTEIDMDQYACSEAIDCMKAYYKVRT